MGRFCPSPVRMLKVLKIYTFVFNVLLAFANSTCARMCGCGKAWSISRCLCHRRPPPTNAPPVRVSVCHSTGCRTERQRPASASTRRGGSPLWRPSLPGILRNEPLQLTAVLAVQGRENENSDSTKAEASQQAVSKIATVAQSFCSRQ